MGSISIKDAATRLGVCERTIRNAVSRGELKAVYGGLHKNIIKGITVDSIDKLLKEGAR